MALCNATHYVVEGATDQATATTFVPRRGAKCPSSPGEGGLWGLTRTEEALVFVCLGLAFAALVYCCCFRGRGGGGGGGS